MSANQQKSGANDSENVYDSMESCSTTDDDRVSQTSDSTSDTSKSSPSSKATRTPTGLPNPRKFRLQHLETHYFLWLKDIQALMRKNIKQECLQEDIFKIMDLYKKNVNENMRFCSTKKCKILAKNLARTLLIFRTVSQKFDFTGEKDYDDYLLRICDLLSIYTTLELKISTKFEEPRKNVANRISANYEVHLKHKTDQTYILKVLMNINHHQQREVMRSVYQKYIVKKKSFTPAELSDKLYVLYLIVHKQWMDLEDSVEMNADIKDNAIGFMKPKMSLRTNRFYAPFLPIYSENPDKATKSIMSQYFNPAKLIQAVKYDEKIHNVSCSVDEIVDLSAIADSNPLEPLNSSEAGQSETSNADCISSSSQVTPSNTTVFRVPFLRANSSNVKLESAEVTATVDLTDEDDVNKDLIWLTELCRISRKCEPISSVASILNASSCEVIEIDDDDDDVVNAENDQINKIDSVSESACSIQNPSIQSTITTMSVADSNTETNDEMDTTVIDSISQLNLDTNSGNISKGKEAGSFVLKSILSKGRIESSSATNECRKSVRFNFDIPPVEKENVGSTANAHVKEVGMDFTNSETDIMPDLGDPIVENEISDARIEDTVEITSSLMPQPVVSQMASKIARSVSPTPPSIVRKISPVFSQHQQELDTELTEQQNLSRVFPMDEVNNENILCQTDSQLEAPMEILSSQSESPKDKNDVASQDASLSADTVALDLSNISISNESMSNGKSSDMNTPNECMIDSLSVSTETAELLNSELMSEKQIPLTEVSLNLQGSALGVVAPEVLNKKHHSVNESSLDLAMLKKTCINSFTTTKLHDQADVDISDYTYKINQSLNPKTYERKKKEINKSRDALLNKTQRPEENCTVNSQIPDLEAEIEVSAISDESYLKSNEKINEITSARIEAKNQNPVDLNLTVEKKNVVFSMSIKKVSLPPTEDNDVSLLGSDSNVVFSTGKAADSMSISFTEQSAAAIAEGVYPMRLDGSIQSDVSTDDEASPPMEKLTTSDQHEFAQCIETVKTAAAFRLSDDHRFGHFKAAEKTRKIVSTDDTQYNADPKKVTKRRGYCDMRLSMSSDDDISHEPSKVRTKIGPSRLREAPPTIIDRVTYIKPVLTDRIKPATKVNSQIFNNRSSGNILNNQHKSLNSSPTRLSRAYDSPVDDAKIKLPSLHNYETGMRNKSPFSLPFNQRNSVDVGLPDCGENTTIEQQPIQELSELNATTLASCESDNNLESALFSSTATVDPRTTTVPNVPNNYDRPLSLGMNPREGEILIESNQEFNTMNPPDTIQSNQGPIENYPNTVVGGNYGCVQRDNSIPVGVEVDLSERQKNNFSENQDGMRSDVSRSNCEPPEYKPSEIVQQIDSGADSGHLENRQWSQESMGKNFENSLPLKKRRKLTYYDWAVPVKDEDVQYMGEAPPENPENLNVPQMVECVSYPSTPMLSIANFENMICFTQPQTATGRRQFKTPAQLKEIAPVSMQTFNILPSQHTIVNNNNNTGEMTRTVQTFNILPPQQAGNSGTTNVQTFNIMQPPANVSSTSNSTMYADEGGVNVGFNLNPTTELPTLQTFNVSPSSIQYTQTFPNQQYRTYNIQPNQTNQNQINIPALDMQNMINLSNYQMNPQHFSNFLLNSQMNLQAKKAVLLNEGGPCNVQTNQCNTQQMHQPEPMNQEKAQNVKKCCKRQSETVTTPSTSATETSQCCGGNHKSCPANVTVSPATNPSAFAATPSTAPCRIRSKKNKKNSTDRITRSSNRTTVVNYRDDPDLSTKATTSPNNGSNKRQRIDLQQPEKQRPQLGRVFYSQKISSHKNREKDKNRLKQKRNKKAPPNGFNDKDHLLEDRLYNSRLKLRNIACDHIIRRKYAHVFSQNQTDAIAPFEYTQQTRTISDFDRYLNHIKRAPSIACSYYSTNSHFTSEESSEPQTPKSLENRESKKLVAANRSSRCSNVSPLDLKVTNMIVEPLKSRKETDEVNFDNITEEQRKSQRKDSNNADRKLQIRPLIRLQDISKLEKFSTHFNSNLSSKTNIIPHRQNDSLENTKPVKNLRTRNTPHKKTASNSNFERLRISLQVKDPTKFKQQAVCKRRASVLTKTSDKTNNTIQLVSRRNSIAFGGEKSSKFTSPNLFRSMMALKSGLKPPELVTKIENRSPALPPPLSCSEAEKNNITASVENKYDSPPVCPVFETPSIASSIEESKEVEVTSSSCLNDNQTSRFDGENNHHAIAVATTPTISQQVEPENEVSSTQGGALDDFRPAPVSELFYKSNAAESMQNNQVVSSSNLLSSVTARRRSIQRRRPSLAFDLNAEAMEVLHEPVELAKITNNFELDDELSTTPSTTTTIMESPRSRNKNRSRAGRKKPKKPIRRLKTKTSQSSFKNIARKRHKDSKSFYGSKIFRSNKQSISSNDSSSADEIPLSVLSDKLRKSNRVSGGVSLSPTDLVVNISPKGKTYSKNSIVQTIYVPSDVEKIIELENSQLQKNAARKKGGQPKRKVSPILSLPASPSWASTNFATSKKRKLFTEVIE